MDPELGDAEGAARIEDLMRACRLREETVRHPSNCIHKAWHDLKESLHVIRVAGTLLKAKATDDDGRNIADFVTSASMDLNQLLNDLPDYARLEAQRENRNLSSFDVAAAFRDVAGNVRPALQVKGVAFKMEKNPSLSVRSDFTKVQRIAENLIRYCLKQGRPSQISVEWKMEPPRWSFTIHATAVQDVTALSEPIGVAVARGFCQVLDGSLTIEAATNALVCRVELPLDYQPEPAA